VLGYNWHSAGSLGWPFLMLKYKFFFQIKYTEAILSNSTRKLLWFEMNKMLIAVLKINLLRHLLLFSALIYFRSLLRCLARYQLLLEKLPWIKDRG